MAALTVAVAIVAGSLSKQPSTAEVTQGFQVHKFQTEDTMSLLVQGKFRSFQTVELEITETLATGNTSTSNISYNTPESGVLEMTVPVAEGATTYTLIGSWSNNDGSVQRLERRMAIGTSGDSH